MLYHSIYVYIYIYRERERERLYSRARVDKTKRTDSWAANAGWNIVVTTWNPLASFKNIPNPHSAPLERTNWLRGVGRVSEHSGTHTHTHTHTARDYAQSTYQNFPIKSPWVKLSGRPPIKFYGHENSHPWELRVCLSQTLRNPNS